MSLVLQLCAPFVAIRDALALRQASKMMMSLVNEIPWYDLESRVHIGLATAALCGSHALLLRGDAAVAPALDAEGRGLSIRIPDADAIVNGWSSVWSKLRELQEVDLSGCIKSRTNAWCRCRSCCHAACLRQLAISDCSSTRITDSGLHGLAGLHTLNVSGCDQYTITDEAFELMTELRSLDVSTCSQWTITDNTFLRLVNLHTLSMDGCNQSTNHQPSIFKVYGSAHPGHVRVRSVHGRGLCALGDAKQFDHDRVQPINNHGCSIRALDTSACTADG